MADLPDFMTNPNAVLNDKDHKWRYGIVPDYSKVNAAYEEGEWQKLFTKTFKINFRKDHHTC